MRVSAHCGHLLRLRPGGHILRFAHGTALYLCHVAPVHFGCGLDERLDITLADEIPDVEEPRLQGDGLEEPVQVARRCA